MPTDRQAELLRFLERNLDAKLLSPNYFNRYYAAAISVRSNKSHDLFAYARLFIYELKPFILN